MITVYFSVNQTASTNSWLSGISVKLSGALNDGVPSSGQWLTDIQNTSPSGTRKKTVTMTAVGAA